MPDLQPTGYQAIMDASDWNRGVADIITANAKLTQSLDAMTAEMTKGGKDMGQGIEQGSRQAGSAFQGLGKTIAGVAIGNIITSAVQQGVGALKSLGGAVMEMAGSAAAIPGISGAFNTLGGSIEAMRAGSAGLVTDIDLMKSFNQAASLVSQKFAMELPGAMGLLGKAAAATGADVGFYLDSLVKGVGRVQPLILDNLGIQVNATAANEEFAKSLGRTADSLSKGEQQQAIMAATMAALTEKYGDLADVSDSAAAKQAAFGTAMANFKNEVGVALLPALGGLQQVLGSVANDVLPALKPIIEDLSARFGDWAQNMASQVVPMVQRFADALGQLASGNASGALETVFGSANSAKIQSFLDGLRQVGDVVQSVLGFFANTDWGTVAATLGTLTVAWGALNVVMNANPWVLVATGIVAATVMLGKAVGEIKAAQAELDSTTAQTNADLVATTNSYAEYQQAALNAAVEQGRVSLALGEEVAMRGLLRNEIILTEEQYNQAAAAANAQQNAVIGAMAAATQATMASAGATQTWSEYITQAGGDAEAFDNVVYDMTDLLSGLGPTAEESAAAFVEGFQQASEGFSKSFEDIQKLVTDHAQKVEQIEQQAANKQREADFQFGMRRQEAERQYQEQRRQLVVQGKDQEITALDAKYAQQTEIAKQQYDTDAQLAERARLVQLADLARAHVQELQMRQDQARLTLLTEMQKSDQWKALTAAEQQEIVAQVYMGGSTRLQKEAEFAQQSLIIQQTMTGKRLGVVKQEVDALAALQTGQVDKAKAALDAAEANLANFNIDLPPLPALDSSAFAKSTGGVSGAVKGTAESATRTMSSVVDDIDKTVNTALGMLYKLTDLQIPDTAQEALGKLGEFIKAQVGFVYSLQIDLKNTKPLEKISKALSLLMDAFVQFISIGSRMSASPPTMNMDAYVQFFNQFGMQMIEMTRMLEQSLGSSNTFKKTIQNAKRVGEFFKTIATFFERIGGTRMPDMTAWSVQLETAIYAVMQITEGIIRDFGAGNIQKAAEMAAPLEQLAGLLQVEFAALKKINLRGISTWKRDFKIAILEVVDLIQSLVKELGGFQINQSVGYVEGLSKLLSLLATELDVAAREAGWQEELPDFIDDLFYAVVEIETAIMDLGWEVQQDMAQAVTVAESIQSLAALLGTSLEFAETTDQWPAQMQVFLDRLFLAAGEINTRIANLSDDIKDQMVAAAQFAKDVQGLFDLLSIELDITLGPADWPTQITQFADQLYTALMAFRDVMYNKNLIEAAIGGGYQVGSMGTSIMAAADLADSIKKLMELLDISISVPDADDWADEIDAYLQDLFDVLIDNSDSVYNLVNGMDAAVKAALPATATLVDNITKLAGLLSIDLTLDLGGDDFWTDMPEYMSRVEEAINQTQTLVNVTLAGVNSLIAQAVPMVDDIKKLAELLTIKLTLDTGGRNWAEDLSTFMWRLEAAILNVYTVLGRASMQALAPALAKAALLVDDVEKLVGLLGASLDYKLPEARGWAAELSTFLGHLETAAVDVHQKLLDFAVPIQDDLELAAGMVDSIDKLTGLLSIDLAVSYEDNFATKLGDYLDNLEEAWKQVAHKLATIDDTILDEIDLAVTRADNIEKLTKLLGVDLKVEPQAWVTWTVNLGDYVDQLLFAVEQLALDINALQPAVKTAIEAAAPLASDIEKLTKLLGVDLLKVIPGGPYFPAALAAYSQQLLSALTDPDSGMIALVEQVRVAAGGAEALAEQADIAGSIGAILDLLSFKEVLGTMASVPDDVVFSKWISEYVANLQIAVQSLMDKTTGLPAIREEFGTALTEAQQTAETIKAIFDAIFAVADSITKAWTAITPPGLDLTVVEDTVERYLLMAQKVADLMGLGGHVVPGKRTAQRIPERRRANPMYGDDVSSDWSEGWKQTGPVIPRVSSTDWGVVGSVRDQQPRVPVSAGGGGPAAAAQQQANLNGTLLIRIQRDDTGEEVYVKEVDLAAMIDDLLAEAEVTA